MALVQSTDTTVRYASGPETWAAPPAYRTDQRESTILPKDPRNWSRDHVAKWISHVTRKHGLPEVDASSCFLMNGKALCLMSPGMFVSRVPVGGKLLYKDFQLRLSAALYAASN